MIYFSFFHGSTCSFKSDRPKIGPRLNIGSVTPRNRNLFAVDRHRTNYAKFGPINQMMANQHFEMIDFTTTRSNLKKFFSALRSNTT